MANKSTAEQFAEWFKSNYDPEPVVYDDWRNAPPIRDAGELPDLPPNRQREKIERFAQQLDNSINPFNRSPSGWYSVYDYDD